MANCGSGFLHIKLRISRDQIKLSFKHNVASDLELHCQSRPVFFRINRYSNQLVPRLAV